MSNAFRDCLLFLTSCRVVGKNLPNVFTEGNKLIFLDSWQRESPTVPKLLAVYLSLSTCSPLSFLSPSPRNFVQFLELILAPTSSSQGLSLLSKHCRHWTGGKYVFPTSPKMNNLLQTSFVRKILYFYFY